MRLMRTRGYTILEILICIVVFAVALLGTLASLTASQKATKYGQNMSLATSYCQEICEIIRAKGLAFTQGALPPPAGTIMQTTPPDSKATPMHDSGYFSTLPNDPRFRRSIVTTMVGSSGYQFNLVRIKVTVYWQENQAWRQVSMTTLARRPLT